MSERLPYLKAGQTVNAALSIVYLAETETPASAEALEFLMSPSRSILISTGTDWTLQVSEGQWPMLPDWCWPPESWDYRKISEVGNPGFDRITSVDPMHNEVGEMVGITLQFPTKQMVLRSGEEIRWEITERA